jgi:hypothetical protein
MLPESAAVGSWIIRDADDGSVYPSENVFAVVSVEKPAEILGRFRSRPFAEVLVAALEGPPAPTSTRSGEGGPFRLEMWPPNKPEQFMLLCGDEKLGEIRFAPLLAERYLDRLGPEHLADVEQLAADYDEWQERFSASIARENPPVQRLLDVVKPALLDGRITMDDLNAEVLEQFGLVLSYWPECERFLQDGAQASEP